MRKYIDLHTHSTYSDGTLTPREIVKKAADIGLAAVALTDHDTVNGLPEAFDAGKEYGVEVISGIEFLAEADCKMHIVGLNFSPECPAIRSVLADLIKNREIRNREIIKKLTEFGIEVTLEDIARSSPLEVTGRSQIADIMLEKGYVSSRREAFEKYLAWGKAAYVPRKTLTPEKAVEIIHADGGKAVLAHLNQTRLSDGELYALLKRLKDAGLDGIEGYYTEYTEEAGERYRKTAEQLGLILSGGSDFHGANKDGYELGNVKISYDLLEVLKK